MMIRSVIAAAILGTAAAAAVYALLPCGQVPIANLAVEPEAWPICTTMGSVADEGDWTQLDPDFASGKKDLAAGDWEGAIAALKLAVLRDPRNADVQNYIGYAYRRLRQLEPAFAGYRLALTLNPRHRAAHEHMGEAYLSTGKLHEAELHLTALRDICLIPCEEYGDLDRAIATYKNQHTDH
jgi:tetratricopeptide (TPR) repeat protein